MGRRRPDNIADPTTQGDRIFISTGEADGCFATGVAVNRMLSDRIHSMTYCCRVTTLTWRARRGPQASEASLYAFSVIIAGDFNVVLSGDSNSGP